MEKIKVIKLCCLAFVFTTLIYSCGGINKKTVNKELVELQLRIDSLESIINSSSYDPIIFDNNRGEIYESDTINFAVGLIYNAENLIDSMHFTLMKFDERKNDFDIIFEDNVQPSFSLEKTNYLEHFRLSNLSEGKYLYQGYLLLNGNRKLPIERYFVVKGNV